MVPRPRPSLGPQPSWVFDFDFDLEDLGGGGGSGISSSSPSVSTTGFDLDLDLDGLRGASSSTEGAREAERDLVEAFRVLGGGGGAVIVSSSSSSSVSAERWLALDEARERVPGVLAPFPVARGLRGVLAVRLPSGMDEISDDSSAPSKPFVGIIMSLCLLLLFDFGGGLGGGERSAKIGQLSLAFLTRFRCSSLPNT